MSATNINNQPNTKASIAAAAGSMESFEQKLNPRLRGLTFLQIVATATSRKHLRHRHNSRIN